MQTEAKFTPGPWLFEFSEKGGYASVQGRLGDGDVRPSDGLGLVCSIECATREDADAIMFPRVDAEKVANAKLIATAPELYDALLTARNELAALLDDPSQPEWPVLTEADHACLTNAYIAIREALRKANGEV